MRAPLFRAAVLAALAVAAPAHALKSDRDQPMEILAESTEAEEVGDAVLTGNVSLKQGTLDVRSDKVVITRDADTEIERAVLTGDPATIRQDLDEGGTLNARARAIDYDMKRGVAVLTGDVVVVQPQGEIRGHKLTYDLATGKMTGTGTGGEQGRVKMIIQPRTKPAGSS